MTRQRLTTKQRVAVFEAAGGACHICGGLIWVGVQWDVEHVIPLALGGADDPSNWRPAHTTCHSSKTHGQDVPSIAKAKRREARHLGAKAPSRNPLPFGRKSGLKRRMDGTIVKRET
jgi:5-methylcytosine-specific restriction enzyme A